MSGGIDEPYTIAQLPRPIEKGTITASPVCSFNASRKRKRHEVAVGIDGEGVNIYNIQNQSTVTSYPLPPQSYLAAPPCSVYCRRAKPSPSQRQTYVALRDGFRQNKLRLVSFTEELGKVRTEEKEPRLPAKREHPLRHGEIAAIDIVPSADDTPEADHGVLVSYRTGHVECLAKDLSTQRWHQPPTTAEGAEIEYATVIDLETARKGLLKSREDVLALLNLSNSAASTSGPSLLFQVFRSGTQRNVRIYAVRDAVGQSLQSSQPHLEELLSYELNHRHGTEKQTATYELHAASGLLYQRMNRRLNVFDLSGVIPKLAFELGRKGVPSVGTFARLSSATLLAVTDDSMAVYDTKYGSVLSSLELARFCKPEEASSSLAIVSQFTELGVVVAISQGSLVAFQVGDILDDGRRAKAHGPLLIEVMAKGKYSATHEAEKKKGPKQQKWEAWTTEVDRLIGLQAIDDLEDFVARDLHLDISGQRVRADVKAEANGLANGHSNPREAVIWNFTTRSYDSQFVERKKAVYLLGKTFSWTGPNSSSLGELGTLQISLHSRNILRWLAMAGYLTHLEIEHALKKSAPFSDARLRVMPGDIFAAVQAAEPTFTWLRDLLSLPVHWELPEIVTGIQQLVRSLEDGDRQDEDVAMVDGNGSEDLRLQSETDKAAQQIELADRLLESGLSERSEACKILLARLQTFTQKEVAITMHKMLTYEEIHFLISILRVELFDGNWSMQYVETGNDEEVVPTNLDAVQEVGSSNQAIRSIARLFSCAIDAVGMSGWLVGLSADTAGAHNMMHTLRAEIAAATEGLYDASYIDVLLSEVGKTAGSIDTLPDRRKRKRAEEFDGEERGMPLGSRIRSRLHGNWKKTGQINPTLLAEERSRSIGKYSFERIRI